MVNNKIGLLCDKTPSNILCLNKQDSYTSVPISQWDQILSESCPKHQSSAFLEFKLPIKAKKTAQFTCKIITKHEQSLIPIIGNTLSKLKKTQLKYTINQLHKKDFHTEKSVFYSKWQTLNNPSTKLLFQKKAFTTFMIILNSISYRPALSFI